MNTCYYQIQAYSYQPTKKIMKKGLPETDQDFKNFVWSKSKNHLDKYPLWFQKAFVDYWLTVPDCETKNRYFLLSKADRKKWSTLGRMATVKRTIYSKDPRWIKKIEVYTPPKKQSIDYGRIDYEAHKRFSKDQPISEVIGAGEKLRNKLQRS
jgi:hypothetical protein